MHKSYDCLEGVSCSVNTCTYNAETKCTAPHIQVAPKNAKNLEQTDCTTFERRTMS